MRILGLLFIALFYTDSYAGCSQMASIQTELVYVDIGSGGCATDVDMISSATKNYGDKKFKQHPAVPFLSECKLIKDGFQCRANGKTPLAGATYRKMMFGRSQHDSSCGESGGPRYEEPGEKYICVKGCGKLFVPEYLNGDDGSC